MIVATIGTALSSSSSELDRDRRGAGCLRGLVRGPPRGLRGDRSRLVPPGADRQRARPRQGRRRLLGGLYLATLGLARRLPRPPAPERVPLPPARRRRRRGGPRRRLAAHHRPGPRPAARAAGQFFLWRFLAGAAVERASVLALGGARRPVAADHGEGSRRLHGPIAQPPGHAVVAEGPFGVFTAARTPPREGAADRGGIGITPIRAADRGWRAPCMSSSADRGDSDPSCDQHGLLSPAKAVREDSERPFCDHARAGCDIADPAREVAEALDGDPK